MICCEDVKFQIYTCKIPPWPPWLYLNGEIISTNTIFGILPGTLSMLTFCASSDYDIWMSTNLTDI